MQLRAGDLLEELNNQDHFDREQQRTELLLDAARIAAGHNIAEVLAHYLSEDIEEDETGEEFFDLSGSEWVPPTEDEMSILDQLLAQNQVSVPSGPAPAGPPLDDDGGDRQWL